MLAAKTKSVDGGDLKGRRGCFFMSIVFDGLADASPRTQMRLRRDRLKLTMTPRVAPAAHNGRPIMEATEKVPSPGSYMPYVDIL